MFVKRGCSPWGEGVFFLLWGLTALIFCQPAEAQKSTLGHFDPRGPLRNNLGNANLAGTAAGVGAAVGSAGTFAAFSSSQKLTVIDEDGFPQVKNNQGALFTEPAWTLGEGNTSVGLGYIHMNFKEFGGTDLDDLFDSASVTPFGTAQSLTDFDLRADVWTLSYGKGITEKLDVFLILPFIRLEGSGSIVNTFNGEIAENFGPYYEADEGIGDLILRTKYEIKRDADSAFSIGADLVLPTGDEDRYMGGGGVGYRIRALYGRQFGKFYPSAEIGYYWSNFRGDSRLVVDEDDYNQFEYRLALPYEVSDRATVAVEWIGSISDAFTQNDLGLSGRWDMSKFKEGLVIDLGLRVPMDDDGLRTAVTPVVAVEYRF